MKNKFIGTFCGLKVYVNNNVKEQTPIERLAILRKFVDKKTARKLDLEVMRLLKI